MQEWLISKRAAEGVVRPDADDQGERGFAT
jgi:hypothetical protein